MIKVYFPGVAVALIVALGSKIISELIPMHIISASVFALLIGMALNPFITHLAVLKAGIVAVSNHGLRLSIILMGLALSFRQILEVGGYSLIVMTFTLFAAFGGGYLLGKILKMDWKLSGLISAGTGICGGSAIAAIAPTIEATDKDIAYAISATFIFDVAMVILFPILGRWFGMSDMGYGLWAGTAVNDTSSVVAAGYAFSDAAGDYALIVKLTRTLSIIPVVLIFSLIHQRIKKNKGLHCEKTKVNIKTIFPFFILLFLLMVVVRSVGIIPDSLSESAAVISKFLMIMALGSIGLKTNFKELKNEGLTPMFHGFIISALVVVVSFAIQLLLHQI